MDQLRKSPFPISLVMGGKGRMLDRQGQSPGCWLNGGLSTLNHKWFIDHCFGIYKGLWKER